MNRSNVAYVVALYLITFLLPQTGVSQSAAQSADPVVNAGKPMTALEKHIHDVCNHVVQNNKTTDKLSESDLADLPIGIVKQIGNGTYVIAVDSAFWDGKGWFFSAYASIQFPGASHPIAFRAEKVGFNKGGLASLDQTKLVLATAQWINISDDVVLELPADGKNYVNFDCDGFKSVNLKGNFHFTGQLITPVKTTDKSVTASFEINTSDMSNLMTTINVSPFKVRGIDELSFEVDNATVDYSDFVNPAGFTFPPDYQQTFGETPNLWRGFFLQDLKVTIGGLATKDSKPITFEAKNVMIDDMGVSGTLAASNLMSLHKGSADGWPISVKSLSISLLHNSLNGGSLGGSIIVPFLGKDSLAYSAQLEQVQDHINYKFSIATEDDKEYSAPLAATVKLTKGSSIIIEKKDGVFTPSTLLHGSITLGDGKLKSGLKFQNLGLTTRSPYILSGEFASIGGQSSTMGFPVRLDSITLKASKGQLAFGFGIALNFMGEESKGFSARTHIDVAAKVIAADSTHSQSWEYDGTKIKDVQLNVNTTAFAVKGRLTVFDDDKVYGDGFRGSLSFSIQKVLSKGITVNGYFGSKATYRYWHFDAYIPTMSIPIVPPLAINGFIGGASYKMSRAAAFKPDFNKLGANGAPAGNTNTSVPAEFAFVPDSTVSLSLMAGVTLIAGNEKAFNSDAVLEVAFNDSGGFKYVQFKGTGYFITSVESRARGSEGKQVPAPIYADLSMIYDHDNNVFHANLQTYMNVQNTIRGIGPNSMIGEAVIHVDSKDWYIYIGRPSQMLGVDIANLAVAQGYFMAGTKVEDMAPPPPEVTEIMGDRNMSLTRDPNTLGMGRGFATGARFQVGYDSKDKISPFYVALNIGAGADIMIRDFGDASCVGRTGKIGFDGWYASGQAYVFMNGKVGIKVKGHKFDFLSLGAAALLQAKLPNPTWLKGELAGHYSILCGFVSGKFDVDIVVGDECEIVQPGSELGGILVISDISPETGSTDVSVFSEPQVSFNTTIDSEMSMLNNEDEVNTYRIKLDEFVVTNAGAPVQATYTWNARKDVLALQTPETLPQKTTLKASARVHWEKKGSNGVWQPLLAANNQVEYETKEVSFTTGAAPDFIPEENISYSYPVKRQYNFLSNEYGQGYVKLRIGQSYLFETTSPDNTKWSYVARFEQGSKNIEVPVTYNVAGAVVNFSIPTELTTQSLYKLEFIRKPESAGGVDSNAKRTTVSSDAGAGNEVNVASNTLEGTITQSVEKSIYNNSFRTSQFKTFNEKWATLSNPQDMFDIAIGNIFVIGKGMNMQETFDDVELNGFVNHNKPLVQAKATFETTWMQNDLAPIMYTPYPLDPGLTITHRNTDSLGVAPLGAVELYNTQGDYLLDENNISSGVATTKSGPVRLFYYLSFVGFQDFDELRNKAARLSINGKPSTGIQKLLSVPGYTDLIPGTYPVNINYSLPGINRVTTQKQISIKF
jgi:hypothetical protein